VPVSFGTWRFDSSQPHRVLPLCGRAGQRLERLRGPQRVSLRLVDPKVLELLEGHEALDALCDHPLARSMGLEDRAAHGSPLAPVLGQPIDEWRAELDVADRQTAQQERLRATLDEAVERDLAAKLGRHNVDLLNCFSDQTSNINHQPSAAPIIFLEPSCWSMFVDDYRELKIDHSEKVGARCFLFEKFVDDLLAREPEALRFDHQQLQDRQVNVAIHAHCHAKSLINPAFMTRLVERLPGRKANLLDTGCCGMAGAFGALAEKYELSTQVAQLLVGAIAHQPAGSEIVASGTSCRHQIVDLTNARPKHMAELIAEAID